MNPHLCAAVHPGIGHIVSDIPAEDNLCFVERLCDMFLHGHHVSKDLGRVVYIG
jgi:hypothetical protein